MNFDFLRYRGLIAAAVGAGIALGAASIFLYHQLYAEKRRMLIQQDLTRLGMTVAEMRSELDALQKARRHKKGVTLQKNNASKSMSTLDSDCETDFDMYSAIGTDDGDDEFYDFSDDEDVSGFSEKVTAEGATEDDEDLTQLFDNVDQLLKGSANDKKTAYSLLIDQDSEHPNHVGLLWRLAKACHMMSTIYGSQDLMEEKRDFILEGVNYARRAIELDGGNAEAHKWFAVTVGSRGEFLGNKEKIQDGYVFKQHVDQALLLRPNDPSLHHLMGRFKYEVAALSWLQRTVATTLFAEPPAATYREAIEDFLQAERLSPSPWKENRLLLAKCHVNEGDYPTAVDWLDRAAEIPSVTPDDESAEKEVAGLLAMYSTYRQAK